MACGGFLSISGIPGCNRSRGSPRHLPKVIDISFPVSGMDWMDLCKAAVTRVIPASGELTPKRHL